jgi:hypothetical protein
VTRTSVSEGTAPNSQHKSVTTYWLQQPRWTMRPSSWPMRSRPLTRYWHSLHPSKATSCANADSGLRTQRISGLSTKPRGGFVFSPHFPTTIANQNGPSEANPYGQRAGREKCGLAVCHRKNEEPGDTFGGPLSHAEDPQFCALLHLFGGKTGKNSRVDRENFPTERFFVESRLGENQTSAVSCILPHTP